MKKTSAFTLSELIIVLAVVGILAAILLPAFQKSREQSRMVACLSNERQIGTAMLQYTQDNDNYYPPSSYGIGGWAIEIRWYDMVGPYIPQNKGVASFNSHQYGQGGVWHCPAFPSSQNGEYGVHEFACPGAINGNGGLATPIINRSIVIAPSKFIIVAEKGQADGNASWPFFNTAEHAWTSTINDGVDYSVSNIGNTDVTFGSNGIHDGLTTSSNCDRPYSGSSPSWTYGDCGSRVRYRHQESCNVVFADAHVRPMKAGSIKWYDNIYDANVWSTAGQPAPN